MGVSPQKWLIESDAYAVCFLSISRRVVVSRVCGGCDPHMTASLDQGALCRSNDERNFTFVHLNAALDRAENIALRSGLDEIVRIIAQTEARGEKLVTA